MENSNSEYKCVGVTCLRDPKTRKILEFVPLYVRAEDAGDFVCEDRDEFFTKQLAEKIKHYFDECSAAGVAV